MQELVFGCTRICAAAIRFPRASLAHTTTVPGMYAVKKISKSSPRTRADLT
jgi:hypothetical protein